MASPFQWSSYTEVTVTGMTTELNALSASDVVAASAAVATNADQYVMVECLVTFGTAPVDGDDIILYAVPSIDGTNYGDIVNTVDPGTIIAIFRVRAVTTSQRITKRAMFPPGPFKLAVKNDTNRNFAASGNTIRYRRFNEQY